MEHLAQYKMLYDQAQLAYERYVENMVSTFPDYAEVLPRFSKLPGNMLMSWIKVVEPFFKIREN